MMISAATVILVVRGLCSDIARDGWTITRRASRSRRRFFYDPASSTRLFLNPRGKDENGRFHRGRPHRPHVVLVPLDVGERHEFRSRFWIMTLGKFHAARNPDVVGRLKRLH